ncbi:MAG: SMP-30/gluconolactonase/LRE family protein [Catalinimonas sp.]
MQAELLYEARAILGEGPVWDDRRGLLTWVDIIRGCIHEYDPVSGHDQILNLNTYVGTAVLREKAPGYVLGVRRGIALFEPGGVGLQYLAQPEPDRPGRRFNDGKADPAGRFWGGTMEIDAANPTGTLYCLTPGGELREQLHGLYISNGLDWWEPRGEMYFIDSPTRRVRAYDYDRATGNIAFKRVVVEIPDDEGVPDGLTLDGEGNLWVAIHGGGKVVCFDATDGKRLATVQVPTKNSSCPAFGGPDYRTLYVTSISQGNEKDPLAGSVFHVQPGVAGRPAWRYDG